MKGASEIFQVVYCVETLHSSSCWENWFLLKCPIVGFSSLAEARQKVKELKFEHGVKFQPVIIGSTNRDFSGVDCDNFFGVHAIGGRNASEEEFPDLLFEEDAEVSM